MGSDGFESKKGGPVSGGTSPGRLGSGDYPGSTGRDAAIEALSGLGEATNLVEISGVIKWFDASKGYGFIVPDNGWPDVLLHVTVLRRDGYQTAYEGARLVCECANGGAGTNKRVDGLADLPRLTGQLLVVVALFLQQSLQDDEKRWQLEWFGQKLFRAFFDRSDCEVD